MNEEHEGVSNEFSENYKETAYKIRYNMSKGCMDAENLETQGCGILGEVEGIGDGALFSLNR